MDTIKSHSEEGAWRKALLFSTANLQEAISALNLTGLKIALVVGQQGELLGTISDGDIRRGLLRGLELASPIASVMHRHPLVVPLNLTHEAVRQLMVANKVQQIPIVDGQRRVLGLHSWDDLAPKERRSNPFVIMAGGLGTRLRPHTETCPKPMLDVAGKPMLEHIIERAKAEGFSYFVLAVHYLGHMIEDHFGSGKSLGVSIEYLREESPLGTAGALSLVTPIFEQPFIVTNGDVLTDIHYGELLDFHVRHEASATMAVRLHEWQHPFGVVQTDGIDIVGFEEKPVARTHINAGIYVLDPEALGILETGAHCDMPSLFEKLQAFSKRTVAYPMHEPWLDVGRLDDLKRANAENDNKH